MEHLSRF